MNRISGRTLIFMTTGCLAALTILALSAAPLQIGTHVSWPKTKPLVPGPGYLSEETTRPPGDERLWVNRGNQHMQRARSTLAADDYQRAETAYRRALNLNPTSPAALTGMAWVCGGRHEFEESIDWARRAIASQPENADAFGLWGDALVEMGDYEGAFEKYQRMLDLAPNLASFSRGAHLLYLCGQRRKAIELMQKALAAGGPHFEHIAWCQAQLAIMWLNQGDYSRAQGLLTIALARAPGNYHLLTAMARVQTALDDYPAAIASYQQAAAVVPHPQAIVAMGELYQLVGQTDQAERQFALAEAVWRLKTSTGQPHDIQRARFHADHDSNLPQALAEARAVYRTRKNIAVADTLAWCYYKNGRYDEARRMIGQALRLHTRDANILFHAGMIHARLGEAVKAARYLRAALQLNPHFHPVFARWAAETLEHLKTRGS